MPPESCAYICNIIMIYPNIIISSSISIIYHTSFILSSVYPRSVLLIISHHFHHNYYFPTIILISVNLLLSWSHLREEPCWTVRVRFVQISRTTKLLGLLLWHHSKRPSLCSASPSSHDCHHHHHHHQQWAGVAQWLACLPAIQVVTYVNHLEAGIVLFHWQFPGWPSLTWVPGNFLGS